MTNDVSTETTGTMFYFAYGSNADPERFRSRVGAWRSRRRAWLDGYRLRFAGSVRSEGGGGAVVDPLPGSRVYGVLFEITPNQMAAMDREEFRASHDTSGSGRRIRATVATEAGPCVAELYTVEDDGSHRPPSKRYLELILGGLESVGHAAEALENVRRAARHGAS